MITLSLTCISFLWIGSINGDALRKFPDDFKFGVSTSAHQIEGAWNVADKGESIWDRMSHTHPESILDHSTADVACNSYYLYKRDVEMVKELGVDYYRFSISWPRLLPDGFANKISKSGVRYYNGLIDEILKQNITPFATLYHWDLPQTLQDLGGWTNPMIVEYFEDYAKVAFDLFGDRVKNWITINEIPQICINGYEKTVYAPQLNMTGIGHYLCGHNALLAHARAWHLYDDKYRQIQKGRIGITCSSSWIEPMSNSTRDKANAYRGFQFFLGWQAHPIFSFDGDYPTIIKDAVKRRSIEEGFKKSRLPSFTPEQIEYIKGSSDFIGLNYYAAVMYRENPEWFAKLPIPSSERDRGLEETVDPSWKLISKWFAVYPIGVRKLLKWIKDEYNNPEIIITENGYLTRGGLVDLDRVNYLRETLKHVQEAIYDDECNVSSYMSWSLMDNYEWQEGYTMAFGLYEVNFTHWNRTRTPRVSAFVYKEIVRSRVIDPYYVPDFNYTDVNKSSSNVLLPKYNLISIILIILFCIHC